MARVGIVYGPNDNPLYCDDLGRDGYYVINGNWEFTNKGNLRQNSYEYDPSHPGRRNIGEFRVVLEDMDHMGYNVACELIREAAKDAKNVK